MSNKEICAKIVLAERQPMLIEADGYFVPSNIKTGFIELIYGVCGRHVRL